MTHRTTKLVLTILWFGLLVGCDQGTKHMATQLESEEPVVLVPDVLDLRYVENDNSAFNLLTFISPEVRAPLLVGVGMVGTLLLIFVGVRIVRRAGAIASASVILLLAGAVGNLFDRLTRGVVVDFVHLHGWPVLNAADVFLVMGVLLLVWSTFRNPRAFGGRAPG